MINWNTKRKGRYNTSDPNADVIITLVNDNRHSVCFRFLRDSAKLITKTEYLIYGQEGNRIYFKEANNLTGWKLSKWFVQDNKSETCFFKTDPKNLKVKQENVGEYSIDMDAKTGLCFIDLDKKLENNGIRFYYKRGK